VLIFVQTEVLFGGQRMKNVKAGTGKKESIFIILDVSMSRLTRIYWDKNLDVIATGPLN
jgi:N-acetylmuramic acid 6-phosphate (MurNAc-6-P) etherase